MRPSNIFGNLSFLRPPMWSSMVVPLSNFHSFDVNHTTTFDDLKLSFKDRKVDAISVARLLDNVSISISSQKNVIRTISDHNTIDCDRSLIDECLEDGVELLDACNFLLEKIEFVRSYAESVKMAVHLIKPGMAPTAVTRVRELLGKKRYCDQDDVDQCRSRLKRLVAKLKRRRNGDDDILTGSMVNALDACKRLDKALSFKGGRRSSAGGSTEQMVELREVMTWAKKLRDLTVEKGGEVERGYVETLESKCEELVQGVGPLEARVKEIYSQLVSVRMELLGVVSNYQHLRC